MKHEIELIINKFLVENKTKSEIEQLFLKYKHGNDIHEHGKQQRNEPHKFVLNFSQRLDLRSLNKHVGLQNLPIYYTWKNIRKLKIIAPTWNDEFELPRSSYSVSDIQDYIGYIIKKHETLTTIPPVHVYISRINNGLVFKIKDGCKLELETPETIKLFVSTKKIIDATKKWKKRTKFRSSWGSFSPM